MSILCRPVTNLKTLKLCEEVEDVHMAAHAVVGIQVIVLVVVVSAYKKQFAVGKLWNSSTKRRLSDEVSNTDNN